jgi:acetyl esterase/lipase
MDASTANVAFAWRETPVYVVTGSRDTVVPASYPEQTATMLAAMDVPTSFYEQPAGEHALRTLYPALASAWSDMHADVVHSGSVPAPKAIGLPRMARIGDDGMKP